MNTDILMSDYAAGLQRAEGGVTTPVDPLLSAVCQWPMAAPGSSMTGWCCIGLHAGPEGAYRDCLATDRETLA